VPLTRLSVSITGLSLRDLFADCISQKTLRQKSKPLGAPNVLVIFLWEFSSTSARQPSVLLRSRSGVLTIKASMLVQISGTTLLSLLFAVRCSLRQSARGSRFSAASSPSSIQGVHDLAPTIGAAFASRLSACPFPFATIFLPFAIIGMGARRWEHCRSQ